MENRSENNKGLILVVDDTPANLKFLMELLQKNGYIARPAPNGELALSAAAKIKPDLVLLDIMMPGIDGFEVCRRLKTSTETKDIPVIFLSALSDTENITKGFEYGAIDYVTKPFKQEEVLVRIKTQLALRYALVEKEMVNLRMQAIFSSVQDTILTIDEALNIIHCNKPVEDICYLANDDQLPCFTKSPNIAIESFQALVLKTLETQELIKEFRVECVCQQHKSHSLVCNTAPLNHLDDKVSGVVVVIRDVSRLAQLEKALMERGCLGNIIGQSEKMQQIYRLLEQTADVEFNALVVGESGTGKELIAEAIHRGGHRSGKALIKVNCAALSDNLLESELFGHVKGAFTGAISDREGRIEAAQSGTIFLDEIGDISKAMQLRLLRFLESKEYERVGDSKTRKADVRVVAATNCDLMEKVRQGIFREDLYYRLNGIVFELPPLRERIEDLLAISDHFIQHFGENHPGKHIDGISEPVQKKLLTYSWPGNIRELRNIIEFSCALCPGGLILQEHLPPYFLNQTDRPLTTSPSQQSQEYSEKTTIVKALEQVDWNKAKAARLLGMSRATIYNKIAAYGIEK